MTLVSESPAGRGAQQSRLRELNLATVLQAIYAQSPVSRAGVAVRTGLTRSTVSRLVDELIANGFVIERETEGSGMRGRPAVPIVPAEDTWVGLGLEANIGHSTARLIDLAGNVVAERVIETDSTGSDAEQALTVLAEAGRDLLIEAPASSRLAGVCLALPGLVDADKGLLLRAPNLGWGIVPATEIVSRVLGGGLPVGLGNEADFAALTVARLAPGRKSERTDFLYVSGEVGVGSALVRAGEWVGGGHGWAGEVGHICVDPDGLICGCGARGCLETIAGQRALNLAAGVANREELKTALASGDKQARDAVDYAGRALGIALSGALNLLDIQLIVLGGHLGELSDELMPTLSAELSTRVLGAPFAAPEVASVKLDTSPAASGAAYSALEAVVRDPAIWTVS